LSVPAASVAAKVAAAKVSLAVLMVMGISFGSTRVEL
jgi:hypothetical protein